MLAHLKFFIVRISINIIAVVFLSGSLITSMASANEVKNSQKFLLSLGFNPGPADGQFGKKTRLALEKFYQSIGDVFDGEFGSNELMDLSIASKTIMPGCSIYNSPVSVKKKVFFEELISKTNASLKNSEYNFKYEARYGPFLHWIYENTNNFVRKNKPENLNPVQNEKLNILLNRLCFVQKTKTGQRAYFLAEIDLLDSIEKNLGGFINEGHALLWPDFPYIHTGNKVISAPALKGLGFYKKYTSTSGVIIVGGKAISDNAMLAAREMVQYQLSARPDLHSIIKLNKMRVSLFKRSSCELPEFKNYCEEGGFAMSETDATMPVNASWLCYPGNKNIGGNPLYHEMAHSLQHIIFESMNDLDFYKTLPDLIDQAYQREIVERDFPAGEVWAVAVEGYMMDGGIDYKSSYSSRNSIKREHPEMYDLIVKYFPKSPTDYCQF